MYIITVKNEDKYFISLFAHFKHTLKIYDQCTYAQIVIKKFSDKSFEMNFLREKFCSSSIYVADQFDCCFTFFIKVFTTFAKFK